MVIKTVCDTVCICVMISYVEQTDMDVAAKCSLYCISTAACLLALTTRLNGYEPTDCS